MNSISRINPSTNQLFFRGRDAIDLAITTDYESVLFLLVNGVLPSLHAEKRFKQKMNQLRELYTKDILTLEELIHRLPGFQKEHGFNVHDSLLTYVALCPMVVANQYAQLKKIDLAEPDNSLSLAENFLWMTRGLPQTREEVRDFETALILAMDDPDNPSLTTLKETVVSENIKGALLAALEVHKEPLHHGAGGLAFSMLEEIQKPELARDYLTKRLNEGGKIYGLGHRVYRGIDPRAVVLRGILERRTMKTCNEWLLHVSDAVSKEGRLLLSKYKNIEAFSNIDLYNAAVYFSFGLPPELNTSLFAVSRAAGWMAHLIEFTTGPPFG